jgi:hypothetical protein
MSRPARLRSALLLLLVAIIIVGDRSDPDVAHARLELGAGWYENGLPGRAVTAATAPAVVVRRGTGVPGLAELDALGGLARRAPLLAALPDLDRGLRVEPPPAPQTNRAAAITFGVRGEPGDTIIARLRDPAGVLDSVHIVAGPTGHAEGAFRVRPTRPGWQEWRVEAPGAEGSAGVWVREVDPPSVLVATGPPTWESRFLLRALDETGATTDAILPLGRGLHVGGPAPTIPLSAAALGAYDVVVVLPGADLSATERSTLERFVAGGGGLLAVGRADLWATLGLAAVPRPDRTFDAGTIAWRLPVDLAPLPDAEVRPAARPLDGLGPGVYTAAYAESGPLLVLRAHGHGRAAGSGLLETWPWRMEAGRTEEHREFWRSLTDWLAADGRVWPRMHLAATTGPTGLPATVDLFAADGAVVPVLRLERADGAEEQLVPAPDAWRDGFWRVAFLPAHPGLYRLRIGDEAEPRTAYRAVDRDAPAADGAARLTLLAHASGGAAVPPDSVDPWLAVRYAGVGSASGASWLPWLLLAVLASCLVVEWTSRRLSGRR